MDFQNQNLDWYDYYENVDKSSWLDMIASFMYNQRYLNRIIKTKPYSVLEVGTGRGMHAIALSYLVPVVVGIDNESNLIKKANCLNEKLKGKAEFSRMDAFNLGFKGNSFSVCCSQGFLEHFLDSEIKALLDEQLRVAPFAIFSVPSCYYPVKNIGNERLMELEDWMKIMSQFNAEGFYYGPVVDTAIGLFGSMKPSSLKRMLSAPRRAQICFVVRNK